MIAMSLALNPELLIADEPTTALDVTVQAQIMDLIGRLQAEFNTAVIMITHDLGVIAEIADNVMVMYAGRPVEIADRRTLYYRPHHPYTKGLIESVPAPTAAPRTGSSRSRASRRSLINLPSGCSFHPRCPYVMDHCVTDEPALRQVAGDPCTPRPAGCRPTRSGWTTRSRRPRARGRGEAPAATQAAPAPP